MTVLRNNHLEQLGAKGIFDTGIITIMTEEDRIMKKTIIAAMMAAITVGAVAGGAATFSASQEDTQLQISNGSEAQETIPDSEATQDTSGEDLQTAGNSEDAEQSVTEVAASLPSGNIARCELADTDGTDTIADIAENVMPAMVSITNTSVQEVQDWFRGGSFQYESKSAGTGVIMGENDSELLIVSNNHVVEGANKLAVTFINETSVEGTVKGTDDKNDLAIVSVNLEDIDDETLSLIRVANAADSDEIRVGEQVVAIGNALGYGQSVTTGIVSALGREVMVRDTYGISDYEELIQTDAAINAGNSGGALLNMKGEVIGINSVKASANGVEGMGYAIPTAKALPIIQNLMNREQREKVSEEDAAYIGITGENVDASVSQLYGLPIGIYLSEVSENSPASDAGMTKGMVMTAFDGISVETMSDLQDLLQYYAAGETVTVTVQKADDNGGVVESELSLTLGRRSDYIKLN